MLLSCFGFGKQTQHNMFGAPPTSQAGLEQLGPADDSLELSPALLLHTLPLLSCTLSSNISASGSYLSATGLECTCNPNIAFFVPKKSIQVQKVVFK